MNTKHTPGPWYYRQIRNDDSELANSVESADGLILARLDPWTNTEDDKAADEAESNARLIAAAPDLLDALKNAVARLEENKPPKAKKNDLEATFRVATYYRDLEAARAVIRKAEDEPSVQS